MPLGPEGRRLESSVGSSRPKKLLRVQSAPPRRCWPFIPRSSRREGCGASKITAHPGLLDMGPQIKNSDFELRLTVSLRPEQVGARQRELRAARRLRDPRRVQRRRALPVSRAYARAPRPFAHLRA